MKSQAPPALLNVRYGQPVELRVGRRIDEDYIAPERPRRAFEGTGNRLGAPTPPIASASTGEKEPTRSAPSASSATQDDIQSVQTKFEVDQTQPTTSIQVRLADGTRYDSSAFGI